MTQTVPYPIPLFLCSLPRSGSTLLQRMLAAHAHISTASEPWVALPFLYATRTSGIMAEYNQKALHAALNDFFAQLPNGKSDFDAEIRTLILRLYRKASKPGSIYFLDKTPRYLLVAEDLFRLFPDARFIFLYRSPLAVAASIIETFGEGRYNLPYYAVDLFACLENMLTCQGTYEDRICRVRYEDLVEGPERQLSKIATYLNLSYSDALVSGVAGTRLRGTLGDRTGAGQYASVSTEPLEKWKNSLGSPRRKRWCRQYLQWIGEARLMQMGYDLSHLKSELDSVPFRFKTFFSDLRTSARRMKTGAEKDRRIAYDHDIVAVPSDG